MSLRKALLVCIGLLVFLASIVWRSASGMQDYLERTSDSAWRYGIGLPAHYYDASNGLWGIVLWCLSVAVALFFVLVLALAWPRIRHSLGGRLVRIGFREARPRPKRWLANLRDWVDKKERSNIEH